MNMQIIDDITNFIFVQNAPEPADVILIPGGRDSELPEYAAQLWREGLAPVVVPSGRYSIKTGAFAGVRSHAERYGSDFATEAEFYTKVLTDCGVPADAILAEDQAAFTQLNAIFSQRILAEHDICPKKAIICCKAFHARRCMMYYQLYFPDTQLLIAPVPYVEACDITRDNWYLTETGRNRVFGELSRIGAQFPAEFENVLFSEKGRK